MGDVLFKVLSEPAARELRLEKGQREALTKLGRGVGQRLGHMRQRVLRAIEGMNPKERAANARKVVSSARQAMEKMAGDVRKQVFNILKPEQRKTAARLMATAGQGGNCPKSKAGCGGKCGGKCPKCRAGSKTRKPSSCKGRCGGKCPKCRAGAKGNEGAKPKAGPSGQQPDRTKAPAPRSGGCGGCKSRQNPGIVMSEQGDCKTKDF
jgi:hypothetical protein